MSAYGCACIAVLAGALISISYRHSMVSGSGTWGTVLYYHSTAAIVLAIFFPLEGILELTHWQLGLLALNGALWTAYMVLDLKIYRTITASDVDVIAKLRLILLTVCGVVIFGEELSLVGLFGIALIISTVGLTCTTRQLIANRHTYAKIFSTFLIAAAITADKYLASIVDPSLVILSGFGLPALYCLVFRGRTALRELKPALQRGSFGLLVTPLLGAVRHSGIVYALALGDLTTTSIILEAGIVFVFLFEVVLLRQYESMFRRGICCASCALGALLVLL